MRAGRLQGRWSAAMSMSASPAPTWTRSSDPGSTSTRGASTRSGGGGPASCLLYTSPSPRD
eukprot:10101217-Alexandrium_andersonii.AAC.1